MVEAANEPKELPIKKITNTSYLHIPTLVLAIIALLVALFAVFQLRFSERDFSLDAKRASKVLASLQQQMHTVQQNIQQLQTVLSSQQTQLQQMALSPENTDHNTRGLAEVVHILQLANYELTFSQNIAVGIVLLQTADKRLASLSDPNLIRIRNLLAQSLVTLQAVPKVDIAGLLTRINALQIQANQLPLLMPMQAVKSQAKETDSSQATHASWKDTMAKSWQGLQKLVVIQRHDQPIASLLPQEQQVYLQQNLQLLLQQAQWAVMQRQGTVYQTSLQQAEQWVKLYFASNAAVTQSMLEGITELQKINIQPLLPDITNVLQALQQVIASESLNKSTANKSS